MLTKRFFRSENFKKTQGAPFNENKNSKNVLKIEKAA